MHFKAQRGRAALAFLCAALALACVALPASPASADCRIDYECDTGGDPGPVSGGGVPQDVLTGTFRYQDLRSDRPVAGATVEVWTEEPRGIFGIRSWDKRHTTRTASNGSIRVSVAHKRGVNVKYALRVFASNDAASVMPGAALAVTPYFVEPPSPNGTPHYVAQAAGTADFSTTFRDLASRGRFNVADAMRHGRAYAEASRAVGETEELPVVTVRMIDAETSRKDGFLWWQDINIATHDMFDDTEILHEYGHHVQSRLGQLGFGGGMHDGCTFQFGPSAMGAFQEAWAYEFASETVLRNPGALDTLYNWENPPACAQAHGDDVEYYVWGALWDLMDTDNEPGDSFTRNDLVGGTALGRLLVELIDRELDASDQGILDFRRALIDRGIDRARLDELLRHDRVLAPLPPPPPSPPADDPVEPPDDTPIYCKSKPWMCN